MGVRSFGFQASMVRDFQLATALDVVGGCPDSVLLDATRKR